MIRIVGRIFCILLCVAVVSAFAWVPSRVCITSSSVCPTATSYCRQRDSFALPATLPGDPIITGTITQGIVNGLSIFNYVIFLRIALSWFPQLIQQFPILRPIVTVTEPYLAVFRKTIPSIAGFDISVIPAVFVLDILSQTTAALGAEPP